ncbi:MAG: hypothetical protein H6672_11600 [Anaerolineaceae bacterium]|nr:hypothetical protein [Anaerolineaceae bacterium]
MLGRDGNISIFRVGLIAGAIGILVIVGGVISFFLDRAQHQQPLIVDVYPGAEEVGTSIRSSSSNSILYQVPNVPAEEVEAFYQQKMIDYYGANADPAFKDCKRTPYDGNSQAFQDGVAGAVPYQWSCLFDDSGFFITRYTLILIQPGIGENQGTTLVQHQFTWQK